jgi:hypothetical protein
MHMHMHPVQIADQLAKTLNIDEGRRALRQPNICYYDITTVRDISYS